MVQKRSVKAPEGAEVRRSTNRLMCEVADQGQKRPISTAMRKTEPKRGRAEEGTRVIVGHITVSVKARLQGASIRLLALFTVGHITVSLMQGYHAPVPASRYLMPPGALYRGPHHGICKCTDTMRQCLPPVTSCLPAHFTVGHITVSVNARIPCASACLPLPHASRRTLPWATSRFLEKHDHHAPESAFWLFLPWAASRFLGMS
ncbi:uncharacterized protein N7458_004707 [Penicillium daleae]|uniref:Uncharacterized protein n=1 Tax=Penicillium daleae TaxID=63821 RepID=A0AAD6C6K0_9EURO|nr:uncharacterized protein N7458_004707 [Penicillium daleae]KAJ5453751.1 hypothetical protein N7458_004707 [Penicillium daleae]